MAHRLDDLKMLDTGRWKAQMQSQTNGGDDTRDSDRLIESGPPTPAPVGGSLFNLPNPMHNGEFVKPYIRKRDAQADKFRGEMMWIDPKTFERVDMPPGGGKDWMTSRVAVPTSGDDWTSVQLGSTLKYRIPPTSVTRKMGDCKFFFGLCGWRLSAAQWIWCAFTHSNHAHAQTQTQTHKSCFAGRWLNFVCFCVHTAMVFVTLHMAYWRHGRSAFNRHGARRDPHLPHPRRAHAPHAGQQRVAVVARMEPHLLRPQLGPLPVRQWNAGAQPLRAHTCNPLNALARTHAPLPAQINFASLICAFFGTSAVFHFWAIVVGAYER